MLTTTYSMQGLEGICKQLLVSPFLYLTIWFPVGAKIFDGSALVRQLPIITSTRLNRCLPALVGNSSTY